MEARRSTDYLRLVINPLGSAHPLLETAGAEGDLQEMLSITLTSSKRSIMRHPTAQTLDPLL